MAPETKSPPQLIYRIGRKPDAWQPPDWALASTDGTFGNRFDDPEGYYRVLYAASQELSCFIETLARFRPDLTLLMELQSIDGDNDFPNPGEIPAEWWPPRVLGSASAHGNYADIYGAQWIMHLRPKLASECLRLGIKDLDASVLQSAAPRRITQLAGRAAYELGLAGIYYRSRYGHDLENWALFEPFRIRDMNSTPLSKEHPDVRSAVEILGLKLL